MRSDAQPPNRDWTDDSANRTHTLPGVTAEDKGLGVYGITLAGSATGNGTLRPACDGNPNGNYCPQAWTAYGFSYQLNEGITSNLSLTPQDIVDRTGTPVTWTEKIDRTAPTIAVSDDLGTLTSTPVTDGQDLFAGTVTATDGSVTGTNSDRRSGVKTLKFLIDGAEIDSAMSDPACIDSCAVALPEYTFSYDEYQPGSTHELKVIAVDRLDHPATKTWSVKVPAPSDYGDLLSSWRTKVEAGVDAGSPLPLTGSMPAVPADWSTPDACEGSTAAVGACFDRTKQWISAVQTWISSNRLTALDFSNLPEMPTYGWAPIVTASDLTYAMHRGFEIIKKSTVLTDLTARSRVALTFHVPQTPAQVLAVLGSPVLTQGVELRGVFEPGGMAVTGAASQSPLQLTADQITRFYNDQLALVQRQTASLNDSIADPGGDDGTFLEDDDLQAAQTRLAQMNRMATALNERQPYITGIVADVSVAQLSALVALPGAALKTLGSSSLLDPDDSSGLLNRTLENSSTDAEVAAWRASGQPPADSSTSARLAEPDLTQAAALDIINGKTCRQLGESVRALNIPDSFMPNRESARITLKDGNDKVSQLRMRWTLPGALRWFCGAPAAKRGFEPDTKPRDNGIVNGPTAEPRWSGNWTDSGWLSDLPKPYKDDLACGTLANCDNTDVYKVSTYPDFSIGSGNPSALHYGALYSTSFETDTGDTNSGVAYIRGQQNEKAKSKLENGYCRTRSLASFHVYLDRYCMFGRGKYKFMSITVPNQRFKNRKYSWLPDDRPSDYTVIGTGKGSGGR
jgi:hypothetical protein